MRTLAAATSMMVAVLAISLAVPASAAPKPYTINVITSLTGGGAFLGGGEKDNLEALQQSINSTGGIQGHPLHFVFHDDETRPQVAVQLASEVLASNPAVVLGPSLVAMCSAVAPLMKHGPVLYCLSPGLHPSPTGYAFSASASSSDQYNVMMRFFRLKGWTRLAVLTATDATGQDADNGIKEAMALPQNHVIKIVAHEHFNLTDVSVAAQIERIKASGAQVFIAWVTGAPVATIFKGAIQAGLTLPIAISAGNQSFTQMARYADFLPKQLLIPSALFPPHDGILTLDPRVEKVQHQMYAVLKAHGLRPDNMTADSWDAGFIVVNALRKLGPTATATQLRNYIRGLTNFAGVDGIYNFKAHPDRGVGADGTAIVGYDPKGPRWVWLSKPGGEPLSR